MRPWFKAFPDLEHTITDHVESGNTYACELVVTGTHTGPMATPMGELLPSGRRLEMRSADYIKFEEGRIVSWHAYPDIPSMLAQLGVTPGASG